VLVFYSTLYKFNLNKIIAEVIMGAIRSTINRIKSLVPGAIKTSIREVESSIRRNPLYLRDRAEVDNIFHCCTHKSASQWVRALLSDSITFRYTGLRAFHYQTEWMGGGDPRPYHERRFSKPFPEQTVAVALYSDYSGFQSIPKPEEYRAFFVMRDPRDVTVSWYFSMKNTHPTGYGGKVKKIRKELNSRSKVEGLKYCINYLGYFGLYDAQRSWIEAKENPRVKVVRYESITGDRQFDHVRSLFDHCTIPLPDSKLKELLDKHSFGRSGEREKGEEDRESHQRKGKAGDWRTHFNEDLKNLFVSETNGLTEELGYTGWD
jgi:hypothetical protein